MKNLSYLTISDIHFGHPRVGADSILEHFEKFLITHNKHLKHLDMFVVLGDVTDKPLLNGSHDHSVTTAFFTMLVGYANKNNIHIMLVRGTLSHDGLGLESFATMVKELTDTSFEYIDEISLTTFKGYTILVVPDNTHKHGEEVESYIKEHYSKVSIDLAFVHRSFHFQLPFHLESSLNMDYFLDKVKYYIHVGHIHKPLTYRRIIGQGSFDRLTHGQEEIKGAVVTYLTNTGNRWVFLENKHATIFKRLSYKKIDIPKILKDIKKHVLSSHLEILLPSLEMKVLDKKAILQFTKGYNVSFKSNDEDDEENDVILYKPNIDAIDLTPQSIYKTLVERTDDDVEEELKNVYKDMKVKV